MNLTLTTMGTASAMPISNRYPSAQMLSANGRLFLIDCGEGCQQQIRRCHLSFVKIEAIFISHIHGDHLFGLFGLLSSMILYHRTGKLDIYGPQPLGNILQFYKNYFGEGCDFEIVYHPLSMQEIETIHISKSIRVSAFPLQHKIACYGFRFDEIVPEKHKLYNPSYRGRSYAYCSDTKPFAQLREWLKGVRVLYHEATYMDSMQDAADKWYHSTTSQAGQCAVDAGVEKLIIGHFSSRIVDFDAYEAECKKVFANTIVARDGDTYDL